MFQLMKLLPLFLLAVTLFLVYGYTTEDLEKYEFQKCTQVVLDMLNNDCIYPGKQWPCFYMSQFNISDGLIHHSRKVLQYTYVICQEPSLVVNLAENFCCFTKNCLQKCYPPESDSEQTIS
ncbi:unnamed protein product [Bursaphelenchus okinawaensis]|uniref:Uncharacterized protein n=1 Tax=Bursaphelenchus okinawaensis TaxID=465554 RepID=A0A811JQP4_9BILA|nr:unnamed protein product [Bursaphelenchus okinawaensis]CAG9078474.1 unnamed protein product [Bursaphelenchus okinawaensis]